MNSLIESINNANLCIFCTDTCKHQLVDFGRLILIECPNCGNIKISAPLDNIEKRKDKHLIAGYLYEEDNAQVTLNLTSRQIELILADNRIPKTPTQKIEKFLLNLYKESSIVGYYFHFNYLTPSIGYAVNFQELYAMFNALMELGYISGKKQEYTQHIYSVTQLKESEENDSFRLTTKGFFHAENLISTNIDSKKVFIAMGFKEDLLDAARIGIIPACKSCGFDGYTILDKLHNNDINDEIIVAIKTSAFVIVDFTYNNSGAYFEAGYAQGIGRNVIRCCKKDWFDTEGNKLHFDVEHYNFIFWENHDDLKNQLTMRIKATIPNAK